MKYQYLVTTRYSLSTNALWGLIFTLKFCDKSKIDCCQIMLIPSEIASPFWESISSIAICFSSSMTVHELNSSPFTWPILSWIDPRASSWFSVRVFLFSIRSSFIYICIKTRCPFNIIGNRIFNEYFFLYIPFQYMKSHVFPCVLLLVYGVEVSSNRPSKFVSLVGTSVSVIVEPCCCWFPMSSCSWGVTGTDSLDFLRRNMWVDI